MVHNGAVSVDYPESLWKSLIEVRTVGPPGYGTRPPAERGSEGATEHEQGVFPVINTMMMTME